MEDSGTAAREGTAGYWELRWNFVEFKGAYNVGAEYDTDELLSGDFDPRKIKLKFEEGDDRGNGDFPTTASFASALLTSQKASRQLVEFLRSDCRRYAVQLDGRVAGLFIPFVVIDAFDADRSSYERFRSSGAIKHVSRFALKRSKIGTHQIFRLKGDRVVGYAVFVTEAFRQRYLDGRLTGLLFQDVILTVD